ncbi:TPA: hypothetical protein ACQ301_004544, partial [Yersinia enterocolitica]
QSARHGENRQIVNILAPAAKTGALHLSTMPSLATIVRNSRRVFITNLLLYLSIAKNGYVTYVRTPDNASAVVDWFIYRDQ